MEMGVNFALHRVHAKGVGGEDTTGIFAAVYFTVGMWKIHGRVARGKVEFLEKHVKCNKVYLETFRGGHIVEKETILRVKEFFAGRALNAGDALCR